MNKSTNEICGNRRYVGNVEKGNIAVECGLFHVSRSVYHVTPLPEESDAGLVTNFAVVVYSIGCCGG